MAIGPGSFALVARSEGDDRLQYIGSYDDDEIGLLARHMNKDSVVLDIGASLGLYAIPLGMIARDTGAKVIAVEPLAHNFSILKSNVELNGLCDYVEMLPARWAAAPTTRFCTSSRRFRQRVGGARGGIRRPGAER